MSSGSLNDSLWGDYLFNLMPGRMQSGIAGAYFTFTPAMIANTIELLANNALMFRHVNNAESPDDVLPLLGSDTGIVQYYSESNSSFRSRIANRWDTLPQYGKENFLSSSIYTIGLSNFNSVVFDFDLIGTDVAVGPSNPSGSVINPYDPSTQNPYQFNVVIYINTKNPSTGVESLLIPDEQLQSIRTFINLIKPVDFACREIIIVWQSNTFTDLMYNDGLYWDDGSVYSGTEPSDSDWAMERHRAHL